MTPPLTSSRDRAAKFLVSGCTGACSVNPKNLPGELGQLVHSWYEMGDNNHLIIQKAAVLGTKLSNGALGRHRANHLQRVDQLVDPSNASPAEKKSDLEVLEIIIARGAQQVDIAGSKITAEQLLKAIDLKYKMTEGSAFEKFFEVLEEEGEDAFAEVAEAPEAIAEPVVPGE